MTLGSKQQPVFPVISKRLPKTLLTRRISRCVTVVLVLLAVADLLRLLCHTDNHCPLDKARLRTKLEPHDS